MHAAFSALLIAAAAYEDNRSDDRTRDCGDLRWMRQLQRAGFRDAWLKKYKRIIRRQYT